MNLDTSENATRGCILEVDISVPPGVAVLTDCFPLIMVNSSAVKPSPISDERCGEQHIERDKLISGHFRVTEYGVDLELLQFLIAMGCQLTKVHQVVSFKQRKVFKEYIEHCIRQRNTYRHIASLSNLFKQLANTIYGRSILDLEKYATRCLLVPAHAVARHMADPKFKEVRQVANGVFCVVKYKKKVKLVSPIFLGCIILQRAKLINYKFIHMMALPSGETFPENYIRCASLDDRIRIETSRHFLNKVTLLYCATDSY